MNQKRQICLVVIVLFFVLAPWHVRAQEQFFNNLSKDDYGFSFATVTALVKDDMGFMWIGTQNGLNRYDGETVKVYKSFGDIRSNLVNDHITCMSKDRNGILYVGTICGFNSYDPEKEIFKSYILTDERHQPLMLDNYINDIECAGDSLLVASNNGIRLYRQQGDSLDCVRNWLAGKVDDLESDHVGGVFFASKTGIFHLDRASEVRFLFESKVNDLKVLDRNQLLAAGENRAFLLHLSDENEVVRSNRLRYKGQDIMLASFIGYDGDNVWIGTSGNGLYKLSQNGEISNYINNPNNSNTISNDYVNAYLYDEDTQTVWLGTESGLDWFNKDNLFNLMSHLSSETENIHLNNIHAIYRDRENLLWIGTKSDGLVITDEKGSHFTVLPLKGIRAIIQLWDDHFLIGTDGNGLYVLNFDYRSFRGRIVRHFLPNGKDTSLCSRHIYCLKQDKEGNVWIGTDSGLALYKRENMERFENAFITYGREENDPVGLKSDFIYSLCLSHDNQLWIGSLHWGISKMYQSSALDGHASFSNYTFRISGQTGTVDVYSITEDAEGVLWLGTNEGVFKYDSSDGEVKHYTMDSGLPDNQIYGIVIDGDGLIWMSSSKGICRFNPLIEKCISYYKEDGLQSNEFNGGAVFKDSRGYIYFGGSSGINWFDPKQLNPDIETDENIVLTELKLQNNVINVADQIIDRNISYLDELVLPYDQNTVSLSFSTLDFTQSIYQKFQFRLRGLSETWTDAGRDKTLVFSSLSPGSYSLEIRSADRQGDWNPVQHMLELEIKPPFYRTPVAYLIYSMLILGLVLFILGMLYQRIHLKYELKMMEQANLQNEETNELRMQFFTNISHELKTPLSLIMSPAESLLKGCDCRGNEYKLLKSIYTNAQKLNMMLEQIMLFRKAEKSYLKLVPEYKDIVAFIKVVVSSFTDSLHNQNIELEFNSVVDSYEMWFDPDKMQKILNNLIANAIKYSKESGQISVSFSIEQHQMSLSVVDTGIGISEKDLKHLCDRFYQSSSDKGGFGIGLNLTKQLVELHQGSLDIYSQIGEGSVFTVRIPTDIQYEEGNSNQYQRIMSQYDICVSEEQLKMPDFMNREFKKTKILIVEDNLDLLNYISSSFSESFDVLRAENGKQALDLALENKPAVIISDANMPVMDGFQLCEAVKAEPKLRKAYFIMLTALSMIEYKLKGIRVGVDQYISKPFSIDYLSAIVMRQIKGNPVVEESLKEEVHMNEDEEFLEKLKSVISEKIAEDGFSVESLSDIMCMDRTNLYRKIKKMTGNTPVELIRKIRMIKAAELLEQTSMKVSEVAAQVGMPDTQYFSKVFKKYYGKTPSEYSR